MRCKKLKIGKIYVCHYNENDPMNYAGDLFQVRFPEMDAMGPGYESYYACLLPLYVGWKFLSFRFINMIKEHELCR